MLDHDDELASDALFEVVRALNVDRSLDVVYTDQDYVTPDGAQSGHLLKPDWSPHLFRGVMFVGHLLTVRRASAIEVGGFDSAYDFVQDFEFMLRVSERTRHIHHVPKVLYHWRRIPESVAGGGKGNAAIEQLQAAAVQAHLRRLHLSGRAAPNPLHPHRVTIEPEGGRAGVSIDWFVHGRAEPSSGLAAIEQVLAETSRPRGASFLTHRGPTRRAARRRVVSMTQIAQVRRSMKPTACIAFSMRRRRNSSC